MTVTSGNPINWVPVSRPATLPNPWHIATKDEVLTIDCTDFMRLPQVDEALRISFQRDEVCTSYLNWDKAHPDSPSGMGYDPPGVANMIGPTLWDCCGGCRLVMEGAEVLYFSTASPPSCSSVSTAGRPANSSQITARAAVEKQSISTDSKFVVVDGSTL